MGSCHRSSLRASVEKVGSAELSRRKGAEKTAPGDTKKTYKVA